MPVSSRKLGAVLGLAAITTLSVALPASAANDAEWGVWTTDVLDHDLACNFADSSMPDATVDISDEDDTRILAPNDEVEGFTAADPVGALIGANSSSTENLFLKVSTTADNNNSAFVDIEFTSPVPAGQLVLAISDIDSDNAVITMEDENGDDLTALQIIGTATETGFNWDDPTNTDDVPVVSAAGANSVSMEDAPDGTDGSTGWVRPSVAVSAITIQISTEDNQISAERIWVGQVVEGLASTGAGDSLYLAALAGGAVLAAGGVMAVRRRQA